MTRKLEDVAKEMRYAVSVGSTEEHRDNHVLGTGDTFPLSPHYPYWVGGYMAATKYVEEAAGLTWDDDRKEYV